ncbi:MAG: fumarate hydratase [Clostridia bacterium]|nr:fumarate hydratase [Clostridia bacterium]
MREISVNEITTAVKQLCISANVSLNSDIYRAIDNAQKEETAETAKSVLSILKENADIAKEKQVPICQDTGMVIVFFKIGQDVHITGGSVTDAINEGVRLGYTEGYLRKSVVGDPLERKNTGDNTPAVIYYDIVPGDKITISVMPKGFGSENMGAVKMLKPSDGVGGVIDFVLDTVKKAGPNPCPPIVLGIGIGGTMDKAAELSKEALLRPVDSSNENEYYAELENTLLKKINELDIGPQGFGGKTTALGVNIKTFPTHIAGLPVAVTISCHVTRHAEIEI